MCWAFENRENFSQFLKIVPRSSNSKNRFRFERWSWKLNLQKSFCPRQNLSFPCHYQQIHLGISKNQVSWLRQGLQLKVFLCLRLHKFESHPKRQEVVWVLNGAVLSCCCCSPAAREFPRSDGHPFGVSTALASGEVACLIEEGMAETLTLHKLDMFRLLGPSLKTTNCIESLNARVKDYCSHVKSWKNSSHKRRWLATALLDVELGFRKIQDYRELPRLWRAIEKQLKIG